ncbi:hypothetical protein QCI42_21675 [Bacillus fungorum]|uniref:hypothetical protein n=1 Tax=Bacillus fungorum TaxID=2039284 RepID=UPI0033966C79
MMKWLGLQRTNNVVKTKDIYITSNQDGVHIKRTFSVLNTINYLKRYGFFLILGMVAIIFLLLMKRAKQLES